MSTIGIAMSGGVDSTVAALLLREKGYSIHGFFMKLPLEQHETLGQRVQTIADRLAIPLHCVDMRQTFSASIIRYFIESYQCGETPNPCVRCNQQMKFGLLADYMMEQGMERIATGHYANIVHSGAHSYIARAADWKKDQSYFLARLQPPQIERILFPLGGCTKTQVYAKAESMGLHFSGEESQDICFLKSSLTSFFVQHDVPPREGIIATADGTVLGTHRGCWNYTIGQRRGLGLPDATPWYVIALDGTNNRVIVGKKDELMRQACSLRSLQWVHEAPELPWRGLVQLRSRHTPVQSVLTSSQQGVFQHQFDRPQRAITPGQFAVFYQDNMVVGSAVISKAQERNPWPQS